MPKINQERLVDRLKEMRKYWNRIYSDAYLVRSPINYEEAVKRALQDMLDLLDTFEDMEPSLLLEAMQWMQENFATVSFHRDMMKPRVRVEVPGGIPGGAERYSLIDAFQAARDDAEQRRDQPWGVANVSTMEEFFKLPVNTRNSAYGIKKFMALYPDWEGKKAVPSGYLPEHCHMEIIGGGMLMYYYCPMCGYQADVGHADNCLMQEYIRDVNKQHRDPRIRKHDRYRKEEGVQFGYRRVRPGGVMFFGKRSYQDNALVPYIGKTVIVTACNVTGMQEHSQVIVQDPAKIGEASDGIICRATRVK